MLLLLLFSSIQPNLAGINDYTDDFGRNVMYPLAAAAHAPNAQLCLTNVFGDGQLRRQYKVQCDFDKNDFCYGYSAIIPSRKVIVLSFRGAHGNMQENLIPLESYEKQYAWIAGGKVGHYFYNAFFKLWNSGMKDDFLTMRNQHTDYDIWVTGHSLGADLSALCSSYIVAAGYVNGTNVKFVSFGEGRVGDKAFALAHDQQLPFSFRVEHWQDPAPHSPPIEDGRYYHHKYEVFYQEDMLPNQYIVCEQNEDPNCSDGQVNATNFWDHLNFFGQDVRVFGDIGCLWNNTVTGAPHGK